jgi:hypothetical protein
MRRLSSCAWISGCPLLTRSPERVIARRVEGGCAGASRGLSDSACRRGPDEAPGRRGGCGRRHTGRGRRRGTSHWRGGHRDRATHRCRGGFSPIRGSRQSRGVRPVSGDPMPARLMLLPSRVSRCPAPLAPETPSIPPPGVIVPTTRLAGGVIRVATRIDRRRFEWRSRMCDREISTCVQTARGDCALVPGCAVADAAGGYARSPIRRSSPDLAASIGVYRPDAMDATSLSSIIPRLGIAARITLAT